MLKKNKVKAILSSLIILLPILFGIFVWRELPDIMAIHFGADGNADGFAWKVFAVFGIPAICLAVHWVALLVTALDKRQREQTPKALGILFWICPILSVFISVILYGVAFGRILDLKMLLPAFLGVVFLLLGNYLPKIKQNSTLGIKLSWTLRNEENWNRTHRFGGKVWVAGGFVMLLSAILPFEASLIVMICVIIAGVLIPTLYSYLLYRQHKKEGVEYTAAPKNKAEKIVALIGVSVGVLVLIGVAVLMFTGRVEVDCGETSFTVRATYWSDIKVDYEKIDEIEYRKDLDTGTRTGGFGSARLLLGNFQNEEFGSYTLYADADAEEFVVLTSDGKTLVIGLRDTKELQKIYDGIAGKLGE